MQNQKTISPRIIGRKILEFSVLQSTNDTGLILAIEGAEDGTVVRADAQTKGRGQHGRNWHSPRGLGLYFSVLLRPPILPEQTHRITIVSAVAVAQAIEEHTGLPARIKWPNDICINNRKVCGILTESESGRYYIKHAVVGIGINVNHTPGDMPRGISSLATSLRIVSGREWNRDILFTNILTELDRIYRKMIEGKISNLVEFFDPWDALAGKMVQVNNIRGRACGISESGELLIKDDRIIHHIRSGSVSQLTDRMGSVISN
jgi:BirA family biotin operon repressor/biotin-[acetyl-CoA-carboxylase] ligase